MKRIAVILGAIILTVLSLAGGYLAGGRDATKQIQASCDDDKAFRTYINGHSYFCMDYDAFGVRLQQLQHQRES
jgi:hypothetical protein